MSKRKAATDLNHDNWDREEEPEAAGTFQEASKEVVKDRVIRTAKRRLQAQAGANKSPTASGSSNNEPKKLFAGFSGFGAVKPTTNPTSISEMAKNSFGFLKKSEPPLKKSDTPLKSSATKSNNDLEKDEAHQKFLAELRGLNEAVLKWIKEHVESRPCCILTPVFRDYDNYLKEIQNKKDKSSSELAKSSSNDAEPSTNIMSSPPTFSLGTNSNNVEKKSNMLSFGTKESMAKPSAPSFSFGSKPDTNKASTPTFSFGAKEAPEKVSTSPLLFSSSKATSAGAPPSFGLSSKSNLDSSSGSPEKKGFFNFSSSSDKAGMEIKFPSAPPGGSFSFGGINKPTESSSNNDNNIGENDEEPQPEPVKPVTEDDAIFTQRVKVFVKKGEGYSDLGVGNLYIKEAPNGWHQAIVRNDTSLGNIIFNILLSQQQPTKRLGKNNVMIVCQPTPQHSGPALPVLLRVKTSDDADKLLETIDKYKKK